MAITLEGASLTEQHRQAQVAVRARAVRDYIRLWPIWNGDDASFEQLVAAVVPLVTSYRSISAVVARTYFESFRTAEGIRGRGPAVPTPPISRSKVEGTMHVTGRDMTARAIAAGMRAEQARQAALVRTAGTVTRFVLDAGRETVTASVDADPQALGWARVTAGSPCAFCVMLASRGPVYKDETVDFEAHDHCSCGAEPFYRGSEWPGQAREFRELYNRVAAGTDNPVNELRRALTGAA